MRATDLRGILRYVPQFREKTFVVAIDGAIVEDENFSNLLMDVAVLWSLNVRIVLVHGAAAGAFHMVPREHKVRQIFAALERLWPGIGAHVHSSQVFSYHPAAIPVWPPGRSPLDAAARALRAPELGLVLAGDYLAGAHADAAARSGEWAAAQISVELAEHPNSGVTLGAASPPPPPALPRSSPPPP